MEKCNLCGSNQFKLLKFRLREGQGLHKVFECEVCSHIQLLPRPTKKEDSIFYNKNLQDKNSKKVIEYEVLRQNNSYDTRRHVRLIQKLCKNNSAEIVDIGSGYGFFVDALVRVGYKNVVGIEISTERRAISLQYSSVPVIDFDINRHKRHIGTFDVVTSFHILEHMADPIIFLKNIKNLLKKNGRLICEVPNVDELMLSTCKAYNDFYWIRAHLNYFSKKSLKDCFKKAGFKKVRIYFEQRYGLFNLCHWLTTGTPQIDKPIFEMSQPYRIFEDYYRSVLSEQGRTDAIIAIAT